MVESEEFEAIAVEMEKEIDAALERAFTRLARLEAAETGGAPDEEARSPEESTAPDGESPRA